jgi:putative transposase
MATGRPKAPLTVTDDERIQLSSLARSRTLPHALVARAKLVLWSAEGESNSQIATRLRWTKATVGKWRQRFLQYRLAALYDELRPGRPRTGIARLSVESSGSRVTHSTTPSCV